MRCAAAVLLSVLLLACDDRPDQWDLFVYPGDDLVEFEEVKGFTTFEQCRAAAGYILKLKRPNGGGSFECGYKCQRDPGMSINVCKETRD